MIELYAINLESHMQLGSSHQHHYYRRQSTTWHSYMYMDLCCKFVGVAYFGSRLAWL